MRICPKCNSEKTIKNGATRSGKPKCQCNDCGRQFVENPESNQISQETIDLVDRLLLEKIPLAGISRATEVSESWLQNYVNNKYEAIPKEVAAKKKEITKGSLTIECDEMWSFVGQKDNKVWIWLAIDLHTKEIVGVFIGDRSKKGAKGLWDSLPPVYRQCAVCYTDFWDAYGVIFPSNRHRAVGKHTGKTNHIERFNCTVRQRVSRLVRKTLSFSKKIENHIGAIWNFVHHYNATRTKV
jgi:IS1 family transposase/transposase-like protein